MLAKEEITDCIFWSKNTEHFHNQMLMYHCFGDLVYDEVKSSFENVKYKFFATNNGKSSCDSHFGKMTHYYSLYTVSHEDDSHATQDLCDLIDVTMTERHELRMRKLAHVKEKTTKS